MVYFSGLKYPLSNVLMSSSYLAVERLCIVALCRVISRYDKYKLVMFIGSHCVTHYGLSCADRVWITI